MTGSQGQGPGQASEKTLCWNYLEGDTFPSELKVLDPHLLQGSLPPAQDKATQMAREENQPRAWRVLGGISRASTAAARASYAELRTSCTQGIDVDFCHS